jgi:regulation of enolase protein 1 (concanavalin A-like superfamily)
MMHNSFLNEVFDSGAMDSRLRWMRPPSSWRIDGSRSRLVIEPDPETDFWQRTHYGFQRDNGHLLSCAAPENAVITAQFHSYAAHQYDQAGLMVRFSKTCWLKTSVEFEPDGPSQLGAVVTNHGYSDWSLQDFVSPSGDGRLSYCLRVQLQGTEAQVEHSDAATGPWRLIRVARLLPDAGSEAMCGIYACSPQAGGYRAEVDFLRIDLVQRP